MFFVYFIYVVFAMLLPVYLFVPFSFWCCCWLFISLYPFLYWCCWYIFYLFVDHVNPLFLFLEFFIYHFYNINSILIKIFFWESSKDVHDSPSHFNHSFPSWQPLRYYFGAGWLALKLYHFITFNFVFVPSTFGTPA